MLRSQLISRCGPGVHGSRAPRQRYREQWRVVCGCESVAVCSPGRDHSRSTNDVYRVATGTWSRLPCLLPPKKVMLTPIFLDSYACAGCCAAAIKMPPSHLLTGRHVFGHGLCAKLDGHQLKKLFKRSVQLSPEGECLFPPFFSDSSSSRSKRRWCSLSLTGVSTTMWQYNSPG